MKRKSITLRVFILVMSILLVVLPLTSLSIYTAFERIREVQTNQKIELVNKLKLISNRVYMIKKFAGDFVLKDLELLESRFRESGDLLISTDIISLKAFGASVSSVQMNKIVFKGVPEDPLDRILNDLTIKTGSLFTVFQPFEEGIIRTSTSIKDKNGSSVRGTIISKDSEVYKTIIEGRTFHDRAEILGNWYSTVYKPIVSSSGRLLYVLFAGERETAYFESLFDELSEKAVGNESSYMIIDSSGNNILSRNSRKDGENILSLEDADGRRFISDMIATGIENPGINISIYPWRVDDSSLTREKITTYLYINELDWIIGATDYTDRSRSLLMASLKTQALIMIISIIIGIFLSLFLTNIIYKSFRGLQICIDQIAGGDLILKERKNSFFREFRNFEEILESNMVTSLTNLISRISNKSKQIAKMSDVIEFNINDSLISIAKVNVSTDKVSEQSVILNKLMLSSENSTRTIVDSIESLNSMVSEQSSSVAQISASIEETNASLQNVSRVVQEKFGTAQELERQGEISKKYVSETNKLISQIESDVTLLFEINGIINEITEQSKLLAMNAAIEAARAGAHGRGFAVVAGEMKALAGNTAENGLRISETIKEILGRTKTAARHSIDTYSSIESIAGNLSLFTDAFQEIVNSTDEISAGTSQILSAANMLSEHSENTLLNSRVINDSAVQLSDAVKVTADSSKKNQGETIILSQCLSELVDVQNEMKTLGYLNVSIGDELSDALKNFKYIEEENKEDSIVEMIRAHQLWVERIEKHINGTDKIDVSAVGDHHDCALGKWLNGNSYEIPELKEVYSELLIFHEELHRLVREIVEAGNVEDDDKLTRLKTLSHEVIKKLLGLNVN
ncbi:MAG: Cache 3/Cache 2 fusion domain-containing protein [Spirochaetales bacterium]|nr:Cache 3/Cache 2 fusion domain-containing protein [Spirochaetales bacterium]